MREDASSIFSFRRLFAYSIRETLELRRDPIRLAFAVLGTAFLMLIFGFGITTDVNNLTWRVLDGDNSPESRAFLEELRGSPISPKRRRCEMRMSSSGRSRAAR